MRKLNEAVVSPDVKQIIDCITLKDWQRAYNTKQSLLPSMMNKIAVEATNADALRKEPLFQHLLKVTRTGISFTSNGASKLWHDFTKDIAEALSLPFSAKEF